MGWNFLQHFSLQPFVKICKKNPIQLKLRCMCNMYLCTCIWNIEWYVYVYSSEKNEQKWYVWVKLRFFSFPCTVSDTRVKFCGKFQLKVEQERPPPYPLIFKHLTKRETSAEKTLANNIYLADTKQHFNSAFVECIWMLDEFQFKTHFMYVHSLSLSIHYLLKCLQADTKCGRNMHNWKATHTIYIHMYIDDKHDVFNSIENNWKITCF